MGKTRNCRLSEAEKEIHDKAVKLRKMTDKQLIEYVGICKKQERAAGIARGEKAAEEEAKEKSDYTMRKFIEEIGELPGIGKNTISKILKLAKENGYVATE